MATKECPNCGDIRDSDERICSCGHSIRASGDAMRGPSAARDVSERLIDSGRRKAKAVRQRLLGRPRHDMETSEEEVARRFARKVRAESSDPDSSSARGSRLLMSCPTCSAQISQRAEQCPGCGKRPSANCQICGESVRVNSPMCPSCGDPDPFNL